MTTLSSSTYSSRTTYFYNKIAVVNILITLLSAIWLAIFLPIMFAQEKQEDENFFFLL